MSSEVQKPAPAGHAGNSAARIRQLFLFGLLLIAIFGLVWEFVIIKPRFSRHNENLTEMLIENQAAGRDGLITDVIVRDRLKMEPAVVKDVNDTHKLEVFRYRRGIPIRFYSITVGYKKIADDWVIQQKWENNESPEIDWVQDVIYTDIGVDELPNDMPAGAGGSGARGGGGGGGQGGGGGGRGGRPDSDDATDDDATDDDATDDDATDDDATDDDATGDDTTGDDTTGDDTTGDDTTGDGTTGDGTTGDGTTGDGTTGDDTTGDDTTGDDTTGDDTTGDDTTGDGTTGDGTTGDDTTGGGDSTGGDDDSGDGDK